MNPVLPCGRGRLRHLSLAVGFAMATLAPCVPAAAAPAVVAKSTTIRDGDAIIGALPMATPIHVEVALAMRDREALHALIEDNARIQAAHGLPRLLTSNEFLAKHAPTQAQADAVAKYLADRGFRNIVIAPNRLLVSADGTAASARDAFMTSFAQVRTHDGRIAFANTDDVRVPATLAGQMVAVLGLQTVHEARAVAEPQPASTQIVQGHYPGDFARIYTSPAGSVAYAGQPLGILTEGNVSPVVTDLGMYRTTAKQGLDFTVINTNGTSTDTGHVAAWDLATQAAAGMTPAYASLYLYNIPSLSSANLAANYNRVVAADTVKVFEASIAGCETDAQADGSRAAQEGIFQAAAAQGQTFVFPAGDHGADACGDGGTSPSWPASSQYVVAVGGTTVRTSNGVIWQSESAWTKGGGSSSTLEPMPPWQASFGVPGTTRGVPDVALDANPASGALIVVNRLTQQMGGTALAAAQFAGAWTAVEATHPNVSGFAAPTLYALPGRDLHDITTGDNGSAAHSGYDFASGRGSLMIDKVIQDIVPLLDKPPVAAFDLAETDPFTVKLTDHSSDPDGTVMHWGWDFGDGTHSQATNPSHTYAKSGHYQIIETVTDNDGSSGQATNTFAAGVVQGLKNPGFENDFNGWGVGGDTRYLTINTDPAFVLSGAKSARLQSVVNVLQQRTTLDASKTSATLTVHVRVDDPAHATTVTDAMDVVVNDGTAHVLATFTNLDASTGFITRSFDLTPYLGSIVSVQFKGTTRFHVGEVASFYIDDVTLTMQ